MKELMTRSTRMRTSMMASLMVRDWLVGESIILSVFYSYISNIAYYIRPHSASAAAHFNWQQVINLLNLAVMHFKQPARFLEDASKYRNHPNNHSSLEESPIPTKFREDSDHSPEQYLYPQSLQRNRLGGVYDVKQKVIGLLEKLKDWLQQLCLTEACSSDVNEQLEPIIDELREISSEPSADSYWFSCLPYAKQHSSILRESHNYPHSRLASNKQPDNRNHSILIHESREKPEIWLINDSEKNLVKIFFKKYYRLLENSLLRISKYSGEKKLRFLLETNIRSIFSETLRISYDLKLIEFKLKENRTQRMESNRNGFVSLFAGKVEMVFREKGGVRKAFQLMKAAFADEMRRDKAVVSEMIAKIAKLCKIHSKNTQSHLQHFTYRWRESAYSIKVEQEVFLVDCIRNKIEAVLSDLVSIGESADEFANNWRFSIESALNSLCTELFEEEDCFFMNLQQILNERYSKREKLFTLSDFLQQANLENEESFSKIGQDRSFLSELTVEQLRACIISGQIYRNEKSQHNLLLIPIKPAAGIFFVRLDSDGHSLPSSRVPMKLSSFRCLLRIVELITPIIEDLAGVCKRMEGCWSQAEKNGHYSILLKEFLKVDLLNSNEGHMQIEPKPSSIAIDSNRLHSTTENARQICERCSIQSLMVYHCDSEGINDMPCIVYGDAELALSQRYIIQSIYEELISSGKEHLVINRNGQLFNILPLYFNHSKKGLVHYVSTSAQKIDHQMISQCLVPLLLKSEGNMACQHCKILLKLPIDQGEQACGESDVQSKFPTALSLDAAEQLVACTSIREIQQECARLLRERGNFFLKMIYKVDLSDCDSFYSISCEGQLQRHQLKQEEQLMHRQMFIEDYCSLSNSSTLAKIVFESPCFANPQLYIYQHQNQFPFRIVAIPIKNTKGHFAYFLCGFYHIDAKTSQQHISYLNSLTDCLNRNQTVFISSQLDDSRLQNHYRSQSVRQNQQLQRSLFSKLRQGKKGKFSQMMIDASANLIEKINDLNGKKYQSHMTSFKIGAKGKVNVISSTKCHNQDIFVDQETKGLLNQSMHIVTHESIISNEYKLKKNSASRTIRPVKTNKLNNTSIFLPQLPEKGNTSLLQTITNRYKLRGVVANQYYQLLQDMDIGISGQACKVKQMYALIKIGHNVVRNQTYLALLQHEVVSADDRNIMNEHIINRIASVFTNIFEQSALFEPTQALKRNHILQLSQTLSQKYTIRSSVNAFSANYHTSRTSTMTLFATLKKVVVDSQDKTVLYYTTLKSAFSTIKCANQAALAHRSAFIQNITPAILNIQKRISMTLGFNSIYEHVQAHSSFSYWRSLNRLSDVINNKITQVLKLGLAAANHMAEIRTFNREVDRCEAAAKVSNVMCNAEKREIYGHFFFQVNKMHSHYMNMFDLIVQQFQNLQFSSKEVFIAFANERFSAILNHISYGLIEKVQIGLAQIYQSNLILYMLNNQNQVAESVVQRPVSFEPECNNNYHFIPIKAKLSNSNLLLYRITLKDRSNSDKQASIVRKCILNGIVPCCQKFIQNQLQNAEKVCCILLNISCKQMWNGAVDEAQNIYAFGKGINYEEQSDKIRAFAAIKHAKRSQLINELKLVRNAINEQTKQYYRLQYEYNSISNAISCGVPNQLKKDDVQIFDKYDSFITRDYLREQREATQKLQVQYERRNLQYQIKSKTFATNKILMFWDKKDKGDIQKTSLSLIMNESKENINANMLNVEKVIVEGKIGLSQNRQRHRNVGRKQKQMSARSIFLLLNHLSSSKTQCVRRQAFMTIAWPRGGRMR